MRLCFEKVNEPFPCYMPWPQKDGVVERIDIRDAIAHIPHGDLRLDLEDGLVTFFREAYRCLRVGGILSIRAPLASHEVALSSPLICRYFCSKSFFPFARPGKTLLSDVRYRENWKWDMFGEDYGTRFEVLELHEDQGSLEVEMEKIRDVEAS